MMVTWSSTQNDMGVDFDIYSSLQDALEQTNAWTYCNYDDVGTGFPRDCGANGVVHWDWISLTRTDGVQNYRFSVLKSNLDGSVHYWKSTWNDHQIANNDANCVSCGWETFYHRDKNDPICAAAI